ncbi:PUA-like domain-containing protein, partial [Elsinoe ampelina]
PKRKGRAAKVEETASEPEPETVPAKKRGRPAKASQENAPDANTAAPKRGRGNKAAVSEAEPEAPAVNTDNTTPDVKADASTGDRSYWLMKAEPESRLESTASGKQVDISFTIDDLKNKKGPEPWDGIRNHQAQKNLRAMTVGDLCFFSESNCKVPGIVGIMEVVGEARPDPCQFDPDSAYYDPKSTKDKPKWNCVMVEFRRKFADKLPITALRDFADKDRETDPLHGMQLFRQTRLSVSKIEDYEWDFIM